MDGIPRPSIGKLLQVSSTTNLVDLSLLCIPHSGYISPETIVPRLSMVPGEYFTAARTPSYPCLDRSLL